MSDPEVGEQGATVVVDEDVRRFDVAVDDALAVGILEGLAISASHWTALSRPGGLVFS